MPKAKTARLSRRKSHKVSNARDENEANITYEEFKTLEKVDSFTKMGASKNQKITYMPGAYARFYNVTLEGREDDVPDYEYWVALIREIRRSNTSPGFWLHIRWLWAPEELKGAGVKVDISHMGAWERVLCQTASKSETFVHSDTVEGPTEVFFFNEPTPIIPDTDAFYVRSKFNYPQKTLEYIDKEAEAKCATCDIMYNPDDSQELPLRYCATCKVWSHTGCGKPKNRRFVESTEFSHKQHHAKGLLLSGRAGEPVRPGPKSKKAHNVAELAVNPDLNNFTKRVPKDLQGHLIALAQSRIVRPLPGNILGNKAYVLRAREWVHEARAKSGWARSRVKELQEWYNELTEQFEIEDLLAADDREEAQLTALFVCNECGFPV